MPPLDLLMLSESDAWSGGAAQFLLLAKGLRERGCRVRAACWPGGELWRRLKAEGFEPLPFAPFQDYDLPTAWRLSRLLREAPPDLVHAHHPRAHAMALLASWLAGAGAPPVVVTRRVSFRVGRNPFSRLKYGSRRIAGFIAVAEDVRRRLVEGGVDPSKVEMIPSGTDFEALRPGPPDPGVQAELAPGGRPVVLKVGHHGAWKGQDVFLRAAAKVKTPALFVLAGRGTDGPELGALAAELGLADRARLLGFRRDVPKLLSCAAVCVNAATEGEGLSGALREALGAGVAVVASDAGGNRELVEPGLTGELVPPGDPQALADALDRLLSDPARTRRLAEEGRRRVVERYGAARTVERHLEFYEKVLGRAGTAASAASRPS